MKLRILTVFLFALVNLSTLIGCNRSHKEVPETTITKKQAMDIALTHAGFSAEEVTFVQTGSILSYDKDE